MNRDLPSSLWLSKCGEVPRELRRAVSAAHTRRAHVAERYVLDKIAVQSAMLSPVVCLL